MSAMTVDLERAPYVGARACAATGLIMAGAITAHTWAGGAVPGAPELLALTGVVLTTGLLFLRGAMSWRVLLPVVLVAQAGLHAAFGLLDASASHAGHAGHAAMTADPGQWTWQMLAAHLVSTALTALVWGACDRAARAIITLFDGWTSYAGGRRDARLAPRPALVVPELTGLVAAPRRGPPAVLGRA